MAGRAEHPAAHSRWLRRLMILLVGGSLLLALLTNLSLLDKANRVVKSYQAPWSYVFPFDHPEFKQRFSESLRSFTLPFLASSYVWSFLIVVGLVGWYGYLASRERADSLIFLSPALAPAFVGLALAALTLSSMVSALAEQGLSSPPVAGAVVGEAVKTVGVGSLLSLICMLTMLWSRSRSGSQPHSPYLQR